MGDMYPHKDDFMESILDYIDFSRNEELWREKEHMFSLGQCILEEGEKKGCFNNE
ncbi:MAG: hypothetical protein HFI64_03395 [Lachnospiraceae bacterium]|nr:hypothetical protein [Lachnospiraceae bacterium]